jgi:indole-3-glycerol phosphate synthase
MVMSIFANDATKIGAAALAANVDSGVFMGSYEDITELKTSAR